ncbi:MAG: hypothetical protein ACRDMZ_14400 [Solirubrobacteraceae bacterium]
MSAISQPRVAILGAGHVATAAIAAWAVYAVVDGIEGTGQNFVILGSLRIVLFGALLAFARSAAASERRLGRTGLALAGSGAGLFLAGGIGAAATDGWSFDVFAAEQANYFPWYVAVLALSGLLFAVGTVLVGVAARPAGWLAAAAILAGVMFPAVFALQEPLGDAGAHLVWLAPWLALALGVAAAPRSSRGAAAPSRR